MEKITIIYNAEDDGAYNELITMALNASLDINTGRALRTVAVTMPEDSTYHAEVKVRQTKGLLNCTWTKKADEPDDSENIMAEITEKLNSAETLKEIYRKDAETNKKYWLDSVSENGRIKEQVRAIATLMAGIFPETKY